MAERTDLDTSGEFVACGDGFVIRAGEKRHKGDSE